MDKKHLTWNEYFNSHPHEEDDGKRALPGNDVHISTHILTKRMTHWQSDRMVRIIFQLTSSRRG